MATYKILDIMVDGEKSEGYIRISCKNNTIKYIIIDPNTLGYERPPARSKLAAQLPELPTGGWTTIRLSKMENNGRFELHSPARVKLASMQNLWHPVKVNFFDLDFIRSINTDVFEVTMRQGTPPSSSNLESVMIAKVCGFPFEIKLMNQENEIYLKLRGEGLTPNFLGYITEDNAEGIQRAIGFLLEKVEGHHALSLADLPSCLKALRKFHALTGFVHGDANRGNFIVKPGYETLMVDFTFSHEGYERAMQTEIRVLENCMREDEEMKRDIGELEFLKEDLRDKFGSMKLMTDEEDLRRDEMGIDAWVEEKVEMAMN